MLLHGFRLLHHNYGYLYDLITKTDLFGATKFSLFFCVEALGEHISTFFTRITYLDTINGGKWPMWWTVIYWIWMIVYGPMVGLFLGKIAKGRSIREFIFMNLLVPSIFAIVWFGVFGSNVLRLDMLSGGAIWEIVQSHGLEASVFEFLGNFPLAMLASIAFIITLFLSVTTLCDSMTSTVSSLSTNMPKGAEVEPPNRLKIFWGIVMSSVAFLSILAVFQRVRIL